MPTPIQNLPQALVAPRRASGSDRAQSSQQSFSEVLDARQKTPPQAANAAAGDEDHSRRAATPERRPHHRGEGKINAHRADHPRKTKKPDESAEVSESVEGDEIADSSAELAVDLEIVSRDDKPAKSASAAQNSDVATVGDPVACVRGENEAPQSAAIAPAPIADEAATDVDAKVKDETKETDPDVKAVDAADVATVDLGLAVAQGTAAVASQQSVPVTPEESAATPDAARAVSNLKEGKPAASLDPNPPVIQPQRNDEPKAGDHHAQQEAPPDLSREFAASDASQEQPADKSTGKFPDPAITSPIENLLGKIDALQTSPTPTPVAISPVPLPPETRFATQNHDNLVQNIQAKLLPDGGTMSIRLDPPELGDLQVTITMRDGTLNASFKTSNDDATRMLSHSLGDLKSSLEASGVVVDRIHVQQTPKDEGARNDSRGGQDRQREDAVDDGNSSRQEQQRKEMVRRLWRTLSLGRDELDMVA